MSTHRLTQSPHTTPPGRLHYLDVLRASLMLLGIPTHAAIYFRDDWSQLGQLFDFTTLWRMPAFFFIAGYFAGILLKRREAGTWLRGRVKRIGIPTLTGLVLINPIQWALVSHGFGTNGWPAPGAFLYHIWFLVFLLIYCAVAAAVFAVALRPLSLVVNKIVKPALERFWGLALLVIAGGGFALVGATAWNASPLTELTFGLLGAPVAIYFVPFALGAFISQAAPLSEVLPRGGLLLWGIALASTAYLLTPGTRHPDNMIGVALAVFLGCVSGLAWTFLILRGSRRFLNRPSRGVAWLVSASLPIYLVHHVIVILLGDAIAALFPVAHWGFVLLALFTFLLSSLCYELANTNPATRILLTGTRIAGPSLVRRQ